MPSTRDSFQIERLTPTESKGMEKYFIKMGQKKKAEVTILTPDKTDFETKAVTTDKKAPSNFISEYVFKETQNTNSNRCTHPYAYCSIIYNS